MDEEFAAIVSRIPNTVIQKNDTVINNNSKNGEEGLGQGNNEGGGGQQQPPPDGGTKAWLVMLGSFFCNGILFGIINSYSLFYGQFLNNFKAQNVENPSSKAALVGSLTMGTTFLMSAVSGVLTDLIGLRRTTFLGGVIASLGMFLASFCVHSWIGLCITFGVMYGLGGALYYTPSLAVLGHYFKRRLGVVNGIVTSGSSVFTILMPYVIDALIKRYGVQNTLRILALVASVVMALAFLFKPIKGPKKITEGETLLKKRIAIQQRFGAAFNLTVFRNKRYVIWCTVLAICLFGYFVPYVYIMDFVKTNFDQKADGKLVVLSMGITSGIGRLLFGSLVDYYRNTLDPIHLQQGAFFITGIITMLLPLTVGYSFAWLVTAALAMGLADGCFIAVLGPIAFIICGRESASQAIGYLLGFVSIPLTVGPYVAGVIYEHQHTYTVPFLLAGIPPLIGSLAMFATRFFRGGPQVGDSGATEVSKRRAAASTEGFLKELPEHSNGTEIAEAGL